MNRDARTCAEWIRDAVKLAIPGFVRAAASRLLDDTPGPEKPPPASVAHHDQVRREEELQSEEVSDETWGLVLARTARDHRLRQCCEACHRERPLEPHHLVLRERIDVPHLVMALCADCHRLAPGAAHRSPRAFAQKVVIPWAEAHRYPLPNRKEYRL